MDHSRWTVTPRLQEAKCCANEVLDSRLRCVSEPLLEEVHQSMPGIAMASRQVLEERQTTMNLE
jgi:hypothetical protein